MENVYFVAVQQSPDLSEIVQITRPGDEKGISDFGDQKKGKIVMMCSDDVGDLMD